MFKLNQTYNPKTVKTTKLPSELLKIVIHYITSCLAFMFSISPFFFFLNGHIILIYVKLNITRETCHQIMIWPQKFYSILNVITSRISLPRSVQYQYYWKFNCYTITHETLTFLDHNSINFWSIFPYVIKCKLFCLLQFSRTSMIFLQDS